MSEDAHLSPPEPFDPRHFDWACPYSNCTYYFKGYSATGRDAFKEHHLEKHKRDQFIAERGGTPSSPMAREEKPTVENSLEWSKRVLGLPIPEKTPEEYEKLNLTVADKAFLKSRNISIKEWEPNG